MLRFMGDLWTVL